MKKKCIVATCFCLCSFLLHAQKRFSLEDCFTLAKANNYTIQQSRNALNLANIDKQNALYDLTPRISINGDHIFSSGKIIDPVTNTFVNDNFSGGSVSADVVLEIFSGMRKLHAVKQAKFLVKSSEQGNKKAELSVLSNIITAYAKVLYYTEKVELLKSSNSLTRNELVITEEKINAGKLSKSEYYTINARNKNEIAEIFNAENDSSLALLQLSSMLGLTSKDSFKLISFNDENINALIEREIADDDLLSRIFLYHPAFQQNIFLIKASEENLKAIKGYRWPVLSLEGSLLSNYNATSNDINGNKIPVQKQLKNNFGRYVGIVLSIPVFQQMQTSTMVKKEKINIKNAQLDSKQTETDIANNVQQMINDFYTAKKTYQAQAEALREGMHSYKVYEEKHKLGMADALQLITAKDYLNELQLKYLDAKFSLFTSAMLIDLLMKYVQ